jgi:hypothetical protein
MPRAFRPSPWKLDGEEVPAAEEDRMEEEITDMCGKTSVRNLLSNAF